MTTRTKVFWTRVLEALVILFVFVCVLAAASVHAQPPLVATIEVEIVRVHPSASGPYPSAPFFGSHQLDAGVENATTVQVVEGAASVAVIEGLALTITVIRVEGEAFAHGPWGAQCGSIPSRLVGTLSLRRGAEALIPAHGLSGVISCESDHEIYGGWHHGVTGLPLGGWTARSYESFQMGPRAGDWYLVVSFTGAVKAEEIFSDDFESGSTGRWSN